MTWSDDPQFLSSQPDPDLAHCLKGTPMQHHSLRPRTRATIVALVLVGGLLTSSTAGASHAPGTLSGSIFEIEADANLKLDHAATTPATSADWASVGETRQQDADSGSGDNAFGQGAKEDTASPSVVSGSIPPNKSDLKWFGVYQEGTTSSGFLHLFWSRVQDPSGTTNMDFEFNARHCTPAAVPRDEDCSANGITPLRTPGDLLITYDLANGGTNAVMGKRTWTASGWGPYTPFTGDAVGTVNTSGIQETDADGLGALSPRTFGEASIRLSSILGNIGCAGFGSAYLKSRSSDSFSAALKDFITPVAVSISNCGSVQIQKNDDTGAALAGAGFTLYVDAAPVGGTARGAEDTTAGGTCTSDATGACTISSVPFGSYWVVETTTPSGYATADDQLTAVSSTTPTVLLTFVDPRLFKVIVLVCRQSDNTLYSSNVTLPSGSSNSSDTKSSVGASTSPSASTLCSVGGASFGGLQKGVKQVAVDIGTSPVP